MSPEERRLKRSQYFSRLAKQRKTPYLHFKDPLNAKEAQLKAVAARKQNAKAK